MPVTPPGGSPSQPPASTTHNPWARSLADLLQPWTDALSDLSTAGSNNYKYCKGSLDFFSQTCDPLAGGSGFAFQGLGAEAFNKVYLLNFDQSGVINDHIQNFQIASHGLLTSIQSLNAQYELRQDGGVYWNAGPGQDPWSPAISQFLDSPMHDNNYVLSTLMDGFLTNTKIDDLLDPVNVDFTITSGIQSGVDQITIEINRNYQTQTQGRQKATGISPSGLDTKQHQEALEMLDGFNNNMNYQLTQWANDLYAYAQIYLGKIVDAGNIPELTQPLPSKNDIQPSPVPVGTGAVSIDSKPSGFPPTRTTLLGQSDTAKGKRPIDSDPNTAIDTVYVSGTDLVQLQLILGELKNTVPGGSGLLINSIGPLATSAGIIAAFLPLLGPTAALVGTGFGIAAAVCGGVSTVDTIIVSQKKMAGSDAIGELMTALSGIENEVNGTPAAQRIVVKLSETDTYNPSVGLPDENGDPTQTLGTNYSSIASATFTLSCYSVQQ